MLVLHCFLVGYAISNGYLKLGLILGRLLDCGLLFCIISMLRFATESCGLLGSEYYFGYKDKTQDSDCFGLL